MKDFIVGATSAAICFTAGIYFVIWKSLCVGHYCTYVVPSWLPVINP